MFTLAAKRVGKRRRENAHKTREDFTIPSAKISQQFLQDTFVSAAVVICLADLLLLTRSSLTNQESTLFNKINEREKVNEVAYFPCAPAQWDFQDMILQQFVGLQSTLDIQDMHKPLLCDASEQKTTLKAWCAHSPLGEGLGRDKKGAGMLDTGGM